MRAVHGEPRRGRHPVVRAQRGGRAFWWFADGTDAESVLVGDDVRVHAEHYGSGDVFLDAKKTGRR